MQQLLAYRFRNQSHDGMQEDIFQEMQRTDGQALGS